MKKIILSLGAAALILVGCNPETSENETGKTAASKPETTATDQPSTGEIAVKPIVEGYLQIKNALAKDNDREAALAGKNLENIIAGADKNGVPENQAKTFADLAGDAKEHAEHIGKNAGNLKHQREHFELLSDDIYQLVKTFGSEQPLYYTNCPMYNNNQGGIWVSETKEIQNPYLGREMPTCGEVKEEIK